MGTETETLDISKMPSHTHAITDPGHTHRNRNAGATHQWTEDDTDTNTYSTHTLSTNTTGITIADYGGGGAHNNMQPSTVCAFIIKT